MAPAFAQLLAREIAASERRRMAILAGLFGALALLFPLLVLAFREYYLSLFGSYRIVARVALACLGLVAYELAVRAVVARRLARGGVPPQALRYLNALVETSIPTLFVALAARDIPPVYALEGPPAFLYAVFIVLSTLRLDFTLSLFTGLVAAAEYLALAAVYVPDAAMPQSYAAKATLLALTGLAAAFVAQEVRRRVEGVLRSMEERSRAVAAFGQQVSPEIAEALLAGGGAIESRRAFVCVLFMDIRDFTRTVEHKTPQEIVAYQNAVFAAAVESIHAQRGIVNQFLGDGLMATFGAPVATGRDCANALAAARALLARIKRLSRRGAIPPTRVGIGLHAGEAVVGNIGSEARRQYSVSGNVVIVAARIEQLNKEYGSQLLVSAEVLRAAGEVPPEDGALGPVRVKGRDAPVELYRLA
ncbi:MAG TPA: adenylate/guanylate cyclase domain-containing protein [Burkholderiales bacterium]